MYRTASFRYAEILRIAIRQKKLFYKFQHENVRPSDELIHKIIKDVKEDGLAAQEREREKEKEKEREKDESILEKEPKIQTISKDDNNNDMNATGEHHWRAFHSKYQKGGLTVKDYMGLFRGVYSEAQQEKLQDVPGPMYTISCYGIFPVCAFGAVSLITGGAFPVIAQAQLTYTASILSFLGGVAWADSIVRDKVAFDKLSWAIAPPLLASSALMLPLPVGFVFTAAGLTASLVHDVLLTAYPQWFKSLRFVLTIVALISLLPTFFTSAFRF